MMILLAKRKKLILFKVARDSLWNKLCVEKFAIKNAKSRYRTHFQISFGAGDFYGTLEPYKGFDRVRHVFL